MEVLLLLLLRDMAMCVVGTMVGTTLRHRGRESMTPDRRVLHLKEPGLVVAAVAAVAAVLPLGASRASVVVVPVRTDGVTPQCYTLSTNNRHRLTRAGVTS